MNFLLIYILFMDTIFFLNILYGFLSQADSFILLQSMSYPNTVLKFGLIINKIKNSLTKYNLNSFCQLQEICYIFFLIFTKKKKKVRNSITSLGMRVVGITLQMGKKIEEMLIIDITHFDWSSILKSSRHRRLEKKNRKYIFDWFTHTQYR